MFVCGRDEFGWITYVSYDDARKAGWFEGIEDKIRIPKPRWEPSFNEYDDTFSFTPVIEEMTQEVWEIEERYLTSVVVELLRDRGYTVIEPEDPRHIRNQIQHYYE